MAYVDSSGKTHVSLSDAASGYAAKHTASRDAKGNIVGNSSGSRYAREQEAKRAAAVEQSRKLEEAKRQTTNFFSRDSAGNVTIAQTGKRVNQSRSIINKVKSFGNTKANKQNIVSYAKNLYGAGKSIAAGRELTSKQREAVERFSTTKEFKHSNIAKAIDHSGKDLSTWLKKKTHAVEATQTTENIPVVGSVVKGLYDITDIGNMAGQVAYGAERYVQAPRTILPSVPVGAGIVVQSFEDDPVRFVTNLVVMNRAGRIPGKAKVKTLEGIQKVKATDAYAKTNININKMMKDESAQVKIGGSEAGKRAVDRWDKIAAKKASEKPSFELVEDANGNLVLKEIQAVKQSVKKETTSGGSEREVSTGNGQKLIMLNKSETVLETLSKMEPVEVWDLSTITKPRIETKIDQFKASQKASIAREKMKAHEFKLKEKPKVEIKSKAAGRKHVEPKHKMTQAQKNAAKRKQTETVEEITDVTKLEKVKRDIKIMQLGKEELSVKKVKIAKKKQTQSTKAITKTKNVLKVLQKTKTEIIPKIKTKTDAIPLPVIVSVPRLVVPQAYVPFVQNEAITDVKTMDGAVEPAKMFNVTNDTKKGSKTSTKTDIKPDAKQDIKPPTKKVFNKTTPKTKERSISRKIEVPRKKVIFPFKNKRKPQSTDNVQELTDKRAHRIIKNVLGNMDSFFGETVTQKRKPTTKRKTTTKKRSTKRKSKTR